jgi:hypothetical protein
VVVSQRISTNNGTSIDQSQAIKKPGHEHGDLFMLFVSEEIQLVIDIDGGNSVPIRVEVNNINQHVGIPSGERLGLPLPGGGAACEIPH